MTDKTMTFRIGDDHEDVMKETLTEVFDALQVTKSALQQAKLQSFMMRVM